MDKRYNAATSRASSDPLYAWEFYYGPFVLSVGRRGLWALRDYHHGLLFILPGKKQ